MPSPEHIAEALREAGYEAFVEVESGHPTTSISTEIRYTSGKMPIVIRFYNDLYDDPDEKDYDYFDWMEELVPDAEARKTIRRFIFVDAMENVEQRAFQSVVKYICVKTDALIFA